MPIQCPNCGRTLPRGDAQFCSNCGTHVSVDPHGPQPLSSPKDAPILPSEQAHIEEQVPPKSPVRELHVRVWEQDEPFPAPLPEKSVLAPAKEEKATVRRNENIIADIPTVVVEWTNGQARPSMPLPMPGMQTPRFYASSPPFEQPAAHPAQQPGLSQKPSSSAFVTPAKRPKRLVPLLFTIVLLCSFGAVAFWAWTYVFQPFSIPPVTQPQQSFQNAGLGVAVSYPNGWTVQVDQNNGTAHFSDGTHTARFSIGVVASNGQDAGQYLLQEAKQLGMTAPKPGPPLSFAKASWQQVQGSIVQNGANYTVALLMTTHADRLYSVIQQAPQATYADEDQVIFSTMRSSFKFLL